jgi:O-acetyl-ADP-ribose deacetylase (regulator of RNase III)
MAPGIELVQGDIVTERADAIVNAANTALRPGGGVDGAVTRAAGPQALADRERVIRERGDPALPTGDAVATIAGHLAARWIIHTAGPIYAGTDADREALASCHRACLRVADELGAGVVAFPAISTGIYGYPVDEAAPIALRTVTETPTAVELVRFVLFDAATLDAFERAARRPA